RAVSLPLGGHLRTPAVLATGPARMEADSVAKHAGQRVCRSFRFEARRNSVFSPRSVFARLRQTTRDSFRRSQARRWEEATGAGGSDRSCGHGDPVEAMIGITVHREVGGGTGTRRDREADVSDRRLGL